MESQVQASKLMIAEIELDVEVLEEVIAPGGGDNHNETLVSD